MKLELEEANADLESDQYDKFISDQTALLDTLYTEYETILNSRLDNIDFLLEQVIDGINMAAGAEGTITSALGADGAIALALGNSATTIGETLKTEVGNVGTKLGTPAVYVGNAVCCRTAFAGCVSGLHSGEFRQRKSSFILSPRKNRASERSFEG